MTKYPSQTADRFLVRLPDGMRDRIAREAFINQRTMTKEIVARLQSTMDGAPGAQLPPAVQEAVDAEMAARGGTPDDALTRLVQVAQAQGGTVFNLTVPADMKMGQLLELLQASKVVIPADASITVTRATPPPTA